MSYPKKNLTVSAAFALACLLAFPTAGPGSSIPRGQDIQNILPKKDRARLWNERLAWRLENILPAVMRREKIDLWLVINREYNEDPVYLTLMPEPTMTARRTSILIFHDRGPDKGLERLSGSPFADPDWYRPTWTDKKILQFDNLARVVKELDPKRIGIDVSPTWAFGDGLSVSLKEALVKALGPELSSRLVSADKVCLGWLERRSPQELSLYRHICGIAHDIIAEFFSSRVIVPDVTTADSVEWWIRQRVTELGLGTWFQPSVDIIRSRKDAALYKEKSVIRRGDLLHCDLGIKYLGLCTDMQWHAYVLREGESDAPQGLKNALNRAVSVAGVFMAEFQTGRTGYEIVTTTMAKAGAAGLRPLIYSHPLGTHGHAAGCVMEARPPEHAPEGTRAQMAYPLFPDTVYAIEFSSTTSVPEWDGQDVSISYEEDAAFRADGCRFLDGQQTELILIR
jgi:hypothetical protein